MAFKDFSIQLILRILGMAISLGLFFYLAFAYDLLFTLIIIALLFFLQAYELWHYQMRLLRETRKFLEGVRFEDYSTRFELAQSGQAFAKLEQEFLKLLQKLKNAKNTGDQHQEVLKLVLENVSLGLILIDQEGKVVFSNEKCTELLGVPVFKDWQKMRDRLPSLAQAIGDFSFTGRKTWNLEQNGKNEEFYLDLRHIKVSDQELHLISLGTIRNVIEEKEINAWHRLIRILAHEVMNSVTPVVSLSETLSTMLYDQGQLKKASDLDEDLMKDIGEGLNTINRRSKGMLSFVEEYRKLSQIPAPQNALVSIKQLFEDCIALMQKQADEKGVKLSFQVDQSRLAIEADQKMIEQVLINLIKNALAAMDGQGEGKIELRAKLGDEGVIIEVEDNGEGIDSELLPQIFIPFFTTRKNGSGIGLSLSKNIMKLHHGDLRVQSKAGEGTVFSLCFCENR